MVCYTEVPFEAGLTVATLYIKKFSQIYISCMNDSAPFLYYLYCICKWVCQLFSFLFIVVSCRYKQPNVLPLMCGIRVITKLPNTNQSSKGKGKTHKSTNRQNQSTTGKLEKPQWPWLGTGISKEMVDSASTFCTIHVYRLILDSAQYQW